MATGEGVLVLTGLADTRRAIRNYSPELLKAMNKRIRDEGNQLRDFARLLVPEAPPAKGWRTTPAVNPRSRGGAGWPAWDIAEIRKGIKFKAGGRKRQKGSQISDAYSLRTESAAGAIYEVAGRRSSGNGTGVGLITQLNSKGVASRGIWAALDIWGRDRMRQVITDIVEDTQRQLQAALDAANDREGV